MLTNPVAHGGDASDAFHVAIPSLPGFGFSGPVQDAGWTTDRIAAAWVELMTRLGYERFAVHGGDIGATECQRSAGSHRSGWSVCT